MKKKETMLDGEGERDHSAGGRAHEGLGSRCCAKRTWVGNWRPPIGALIGPGAKRVKGGGFQLKSRRVTRGAEGPRVGIPVESPVFEGGRACRDLLVDRRRHFFLLCLDIFARVVFNVESMRTFCLVLFSVE